MKFLSSFCDGTARDVLSSLSNLSDIVIAAATVVGLLYAYQQYKQLKLEQKERLLEQNDRLRQHRLSIAQHAISSLNNDELAQFANNTLDWAKGIVLVPSGWRDIIGPKLEVDVYLIEEALEPELTDDIAKNPIGLLYRNAFVRLFNHLEAIHDMRERGLIDSQDLHPLKWTTSQLDNWKYADRAKRRKPDRFFKDAIVAWYSGKQLWKL